MGLGYVAAGSGRLSEADTIFSAIQAARPESEYPQIGRAVVRLNAGQHAEAIALLRHAMEINPDSDLAMAFLGLTLQQAGFGQASSEVLQQVVDADGTPEAIALAKSILEG